MMMANEGHYSTRTRHIDIKYFAILEWVEDDKLKLSRIDTQHNASDSLTKATGRIKFHSHMDVLMGKHVPDAFQQFMQTNKTGST